MKKGFFLLEALLACVLLTVLVGSVMHHYAQWSCSYRNALQRGKALAALMMLVEQRVQSCPESEPYTITTKKLSIDPPTISMHTIPRIECSSPQCVEIAAAWHDEGYSAPTVSLVVGRMHAP
jgi:Tfp pilus assembly protein PilV